jgi:hypothetical protein
LDDCLYRRECGIADEVHKNIMGAPPPAAPRRDTRAVSLAPRRGTLFFLRLNGNAATRDANAVPTHRLYARGDGHTRGAGGGAVQ